VKAKGIINATGPFADAIQQMDEPGKKEIVAPSLGVHVVLPGYLSPQNMGLIDPSTSDGRVIFFLPWQGNTIAGTTDAPCSISQNPVAGEKDIEWILDEIRTYLTPDIEVQRSDILAAWSGMLAPLNSVDDKTTDKKNVGIRPLVRDPNSKNTESLVRSHLVTVSKSGLLTCAGGKWTTYRQMAEDAVDKAIEVFELQPKPISYVPDISGVNGTDPSVHLLNGTCQTHHIRLIGAHGYSTTLFINLIQHFGLDMDVAKHLASDYGDRAWDVAALASPIENAAHYPLRGQRLSPLYPFIDGEVRYAVRSEYAQTAVDVLARRTRLSFLNAQAALQALPRVIDIMAEELKWSEKRKENEWKDTVNFLRSMGLPSDMLHVTREDVLKGKLPASNVLPVVPASKVPLKATLESVGEAHGPIP